MEIRTNTILTPVSKIIKPYDCSLIAQDGPDIAGKFSLIGLQSPYDSQVTGKMTILPGETKPIMYGYLGTQCTFLAIKPTYNANRAYNSSRAFGYSYRQENDCKTDSTTCGNPSSSDAFGYPTDRYINYYYDYESSYWSGSSIHMKTFTDLLILTGNEAHKIPQIFVNNPTAYTIELQMLIANIGDNVIATSLDEEILTFTGLYYTSIESDVIIFGSTTGSSQLQIYDINDNLVCTIPYSTILVIEDFPNKLRIKTTSDQYIDLVFLSTFNTKQAHSRMNWVTNNYSTRFLTDNYPSADTTPPVFGWYNPLPIAYTGGTLTKTQIIEMFLLPDPSGIIDDRDGIISRYDVTLNIIKQYSIRQFDCIQEPGVYNLTFSITDIAGNTNNTTQILTVYGGAPTINIKTSSAANTMYIDDSFYSKSTPYNYIDNLDLITYYIDSVVDAVDGNIPVSSTTVSILQVSGSSSGLTSSGITLVGNYLIDFTDTNGGNLSTSITKYLNVYTSSSISPVILFNYSGFTFNLSAMTGLTQSEFINLTVSAITESNVLILSGKLYDTTVTLSNINITGTLTFPTTSGMWVANYNVSNYSRIPNVPPSIIIQI